MSGTRLQLDPKSWNKVNKVHPNLFNTTTGSFNTKNGESLHAYEFWCWGEYKSQRTFDEIEMDLEVFCKNSIDYTILVCPQDGDDKFFKDWQTKFEAWKKDHPSSILSKAPIDKFIRIQDWQKSKRWQEANTNYASFRKGDKQATVADILEKDTALFQKTHASLKKKSEDVSSHLIETATDYISVMELKGSKTINLVFYPFNLTQVQNNAEKNMAAMGYQEKSIIHVKPTYAVLAEAALSATPQPVVSQLPNTSALQPAASQSVVPRLPVITPVDQVSPPLTHVQYFRALADELARSANDGSVSTDTAGLLLASTIDGLVKQQLQQQQYYSKKNPSLLFASTHNRKDDPNNLDRQASPTSTM